MIEKIEVVESGGRALFYYDGLLFDTFFADVLSWQDHQEMAVSNVRGEQKEGIQFWDCCARGQAWAFTYKQSFTYAVHSFQFEADDTISFNLKDEWGAMVNIRSRIEESYVRNHISAQIQKAGADALGNLSREKQEELMAPFRQEARAFIDANPAGPLRFNSAHDREIEWK